ncbi:polygalacturonase [Phlegmacium glaucopus]|nr:polygalacturonase [Phlegmacium glaucopus]
MPVKRVELESNGATLVDAACSANISSLSDVANAVKCTTITLNGFTVPAGKTLSLPLVNGTTVTMDGDISFGNVSWAGPLFNISGTYITFNGNGHKFDGGGPFYWDGQGIVNGGVMKPHPMMRIQMSGTFTNVHIVNSPASTYAVSNPAALTMSNLVIDNSQGDVPNSRSYGLAAGHNTDGFDVSGHDVTIENCRIHNQVSFSPFEISEASYQLQDDCLAVNRGTNIVFKGNSCTNGHGISIGSISSNAHVSGVIISGNIITNSDQALRIKTKSVAKGSTVTGITYIGNTAIGMRRFGVLVDQSYPEILGTPGTGVVISAVNFKAPATLIIVNNVADNVAVNCGAGSCIGPWDWSNLKVFGGLPGSINNCSIISGFGLC